MTPIEVAEKLGLCRKTVYDQLKNGTIPSMRVGLKWIIPISAFEQWLLECGKSLAAKE